MKIELIKVSREDATLLSRFTGDINYIRCEKDGIDWNKLMPVVDKIESLELVKSLKIVGNEVVLTIKSHSIMADIYKDRSKLEAFYIVIIEFIKWYNKKR